MKKSSDPQKAKNRDEAADKEENKYYKMRVTYLEKEVGLLRQVIHTASGNIQ